MNLWMFVVKKTGVNTSIKAIGKQKLLIEKKLENNDKLSEKYIWEYSFYSNYYQWKKLASLIF